MFADGPWRDTLLRFGYDPRTDPSGRLCVFMPNLSLLIYIYYLGESYQRLYFRNVNHPSVRPSVVTRRQDQRGGERQSAAPPSSSRTNGDGASSSSDEPPSHIFDGIHLTKETAAYQLCDITDPMLKVMIGSEEGVRDECNVRLRIRLGIKTFSLTRPFLIGTRWMVQNRSSRTNQDYPSTQVLLYTRGSRPKRRGVSSIARVQSRNSSVTQTCLSAKKT